MNTTNGRHIRYEGHRPGFLTTETINDLVYLFAATCAGTGLILVFLVLCKLFGVIG